MEVTPNQPADTARPLDGLLDGLLQDFARAHHIPGLAFGVVREGAPLWFKGVGLADRAAERPVMPSTRFRIASMTKNTTALAILMLRDAGKVALDAPVGTYVPELANWALPTKDSRAVTLRDLLTHSAGLVTDDPWGDRQLGIAPAGFSRLLAGGSLFAQAPGMAFEYSNLGYAMLGRVITNVAGMRYQDFITGQLLRPVGMADTTFDFEAVAATQRATGYRWARDGWSPEPAEADGEFGAMGGMLTTAEDYARYVAFLLSAWPPRDDAETGPVRRATIRELGLSHGFPLAATTREADGKSVTVSSVYGYGMVHSLDPVLGRALHHRGGLPGYGSHVLISPNTGIGIFSFANVIYAEMDRLNVDAALVLHAAGLWNRRPRRLSKALKDAVAIAMRFYVAGRIEGGEMLAENLLLDEPAANRSEALAALKNRLGEGTLARIEPQHDLAGRFIAECANGTLTGSVVLTPGPSPTIQTLRFDAQPDKKVDATLDRRNVVAFLRHIISAAEALPRDCLHRRHAAPADLPLETWFDDAGEAERLAPRLSGMGQGKQERATRLYMLSAHSIGCDPFPWWDDGGDASAFHATVTAAGLHAANPVHARSWQVLDPIAGIGVQLARVLAGDLPPWFAGAPLRHHLHWLLRRRGGRMAHAATLGRHGKGILILGNGGAGKSGTTLAGLAAGLQTVGDDYVALDGTAPATARPLFHLAKQDRAGLTRIPVLAEHLAHLPDNWMNKVEFDPASVFPGCFAETLPIHAIVLPRIAHAPSPRFVPAAHGEAMRTLIPTNLNMFQGEPIDGLDYYGALVRQVPAYTLDLSDQAADNGAALAAFVAALG